MHLHLFWTLRTNAKTILQESIAKLKISNFEFTYAFGKLLVLPQIERRYASLNGLQIDLMQRIRRVLGIPEGNRVVTSTPAKTVWCYACVEDLVSTNRYKERRKKLNTRVEKSCSICNVLICKQHTQLACVKCNNRWKYFFKKPIKSLINGNDKTNVQMRIYILGQLIFIHDLLDFPNTLRCKKLFFLFTGEKLLTSSKCWCQQKIIFT